MLAALVFSACPAAPAAGTQGPTVMTSDGSSERRGNAPLERANQSPHPGLTFLTTPPKETRMTQPEPDVLKVLNRIADRLDRTAGDAAPIDVNALNVDELVELQERDPALYDRSIAATAAVPAAQPRYAEAPAGVISAEDFNSLTAQEVATVMELDPAMFSRTVAYWATHNQEAA